MFWLTVVPVEEKEVHHRHGHIDRPSTSQHLKAGKGGLVGLKIEYKNALCGDIFGFPRWTGTWTGTALKAVILSSAY
jgi:hypothetical protein